jgi:hypothetical protein
MHDEARFTRLAMVRLGGGGGGPVRRYGLARLDDSLSRLDDIALASPPVRIKPAASAPDDTAGDGTAPCDA